MLKISTLILIALSLSITLGCSSSTGVEHRIYLRTDATSVRVIKTYPKQCEPLESIIGIGAARASGKTVWTFAMNDLRNKAAQRGIYTVVLERYKHSNDGNVLKIKVFGKLMRCGKGTNANTTAQPKYRTTKPSPPPNPRGVVGDPAAIEPNSDYPDSPPPASNPNSRPRIKNPDF